MPMTQSRTICVLALLSIGALAGCGGGGGSPGVNPNLNNDPKTMLHGESGIVPAAEIGAPAAGAVTQR